MPARLAALALLLLATTLASCGGESTLAGTLPDRTVVLTFDDATRSHLEVVAPALRARGFRATFFVTNAWRDEPGYLSWDEIGELARLGFEIGNHSWSHYGLNQPQIPPDVRRNEIAFVERQLRFQRVDAPRCFAWPGDGFGPEALAILRERGYRFARRGTSPEVPRGAVGDGPLYDPAVNDPLLVPTTGTVRASWTVARFRSVVERATPGKAVVLQFHGVPDPANPGLGVTPERFQEFLDVLSRGHYRVVALGDLAKWVDPEHPPTDPLAGTRWD